MRQQILWDFEIQITSSRPEDKVYGWLTREKKTYFVDFLVPEHYCVKKKREDRRLLERWQKIFKVWRMKVMVIPNMVGVLGMVPEDQSYWKLKDESRVPRPLH